MTLSILKSFDPLTKYAVTWQQLMLLRPLLCHFLFHFMRKSDFFLTHYASQMAVTSCPNSEVHFITFNSFATRHNTEDI